MIKRKAISLFPKGKDGIIGRMNSTVSEVLSKKDSEFCKCFAEEFELDKNTIDCLKKGTANIDFKFFEKIKGALGLSIHEVLGQPSYSDKEKEYWSKQCEVIPMALTAPSKEPGYVRPTKRADVELCFYLRRRAIHELVWNL